MMAGKLLFGVVVLVVCLMIAGIRSCVTGG